MQTSCRRCFSFLPETARRRYKGKRTLEALVAYAASGYENGTNTQAAPAMPRPPTAVEAWLDSTTLGHDFKNILKYEKGAAGVLFGAGVAVGLVLAALLACCRGGGRAPKA